MFHLFIYLVIYIFAIVIIIWVIVRTRSELSKFGVCSLTICCYLYNGLYEIVGVVLLPRVHRIALLVEIRQGFRISVSTGAWEIMKNRHWDEWQVYEIPKWSNATVGHYFIFSSDDFQLALLLSHRCDGITIIAIASQESCPPLWKHELPCGDWRHHPCSPANCFNGPVCISIQVAFTIWDICGPGRKVAVGSTAVSVYGKYK